MNNLNLFSDSWYKISTLKVCLLNSVSIQKQIVRDKEIYVLKEPYNNKYFKVSKEAYGFISKLSLDKTIQEIVDEMISQKIDEAPSQGEIIELLASLHSENLLFVNNLPDNDFIFERNKEKKIKEKKNKLYSFLFFKIPLFNPNKFLNKFSKLINFIFSKYGLIFWFIICFFGLKSAIDNIEIIFNQAQGMLAPSNIFLLYFSLALIKLFHELSHASMIKKFGGSVNTLGIMFLILTPLPYMDATHSWFFRNKYQRVLVSFAGMISDLFFAAIATIIWANSGDGLIHSISFNIMIIGSVSSLLFNGNPLLRYDAYYMLADYLEIPNLFQKSKDYFFYIVEKYFFKIEELQNPSSSNLESFWLLSYAISSYVYRIIIAIGVIIYVSDQFFIIGIIMAIISAIVWLFVPFKKFISYLFNSQKLYKTRNRALLLSFLVLNSVLYIILFVPITNNLKASGVVESKDSINVYAQTEGVVLDILFKNGDYVQAGDTIVILENMDLEYDIKSLDISMEQIEITKQKFLSESSVDLKALNERKEVLLQKLNYLKQKQELLNIKAETSGIFVSKSNDNLLHTFVKRQSKIGTIVQGNDLDFFAVVSQEEAYLLFEKNEILNASVKFFGQSEKEFKLENIKLIPYARDELPSAALGWFGGGDISVSAENNNGKKTTEFFFEIKGSFKLDENNKSFVKEGRTGVLKIVLNKISLSELIYIKINQILQKRYKI